MAPTRASFLGGITSIRGSATRTAASRAARCPRLPLRSPQTVVCTACWGWRVARVVLLTGEGRAFCVGADLKEHKVGRTAFDRRQYLKGEQDVCHRLLHLQKPVVAAVNGYALGAGAEMAIASDFIVMAASAQIGLPEISIGNFLGGGVTPKPPPRSR